MHPLWSTLVCATVVAAFYPVALPITHLILGDWDELPTIYRGLPLVIPAVISFSVIGMGVRRIVHFIGTANLFHLFVGTYHRPVLKRAVLMFIDMNSSTAVAVRLGAVKTSSLIGKFLFDIAKPITNGGGEISLYKGHGLIPFSDCTHAVRTPP